MLPEQIADHVQKLYNDYGQRKEMGRPAPGLDVPHFFLLRTFLGENDLAILFNTKRCRYQCHFCQLPDKSSKTFIAAEHIVNQFTHVMEEEKHALSIIDRVTLANEGSILDTDTFPTDALLAIAGGIHQLRRTRTIVLETRLEFADAKTILEITNRAPRAQIDILTGFETLDQRMRDAVLFKRESIGQFKQGLDVVEQTRSALTAYVLFKPDYAMNDAEAYEEADRSIAFLVDECGQRSIPLTIRLNPMYAAEGSVWTQKARAAGWQPPRLTDVLLLATEKRKQGIPIYLGLTAENLADEITGTYRAREDFSPALEKVAILFKTYPHYMPRIDHV